MPTIRVQALLAVHTGDVHTHHHIYASLWEVCCTEERRVGASESMHGRRTYQVTVYDTMDMLHLEQRMRDAGRAESCVMVTTHCKFHISMSCVHLYVRKLAYLLGLPAHEAPP